MKPTLSKSLIDGQLEYKQQKVEAFVEEIVKLAIEREFTYNESLVAVASLHSALMDLPSDISLEKLKSLK